LFYSGLAILSIGLAFFVASSIRNVEQKSIATELAKWEITTNLKKGNTYIFDIWSSETWRIDFTMGSYETEQPVDIVIVSPSGNRTELQAFFLAQLPSSSAYYGTRPALMCVEYRTLDPESVDVDKSYRTVRFLAKQGGNYTARVVEKTLNWTSGPPEKLIFYQEVMQDQGLYTAFLQGGGAVFLSTGIVVSGWGIKATKKTSRRRDFKKQLSHSS
jgi:hypothetical protein